VNAKGADKVPLVNLNLMKFSRILSVGQERFSRNYCLGRASPKKEKGSLSSIAVILELKIEMHITV